MNLIKITENYNPIDEQDEAYKASTLQFLNKFNTDEWAVRENLIGHLTASAWIVNKERTKVLFGHHNIFNSWGWLGGHADGDLDLLNVAIKEAQEESNIKNVTAISNEPIDIVAIKVPPHMKRGKFVPDHLHFTYTYLLEANENEEIKHRPDEHSGVAWVDIEDILNKTNEEHMKPIYERIINKVKNF